MCARQSRWVRMGRMRRFEVLEPRALLAGGIVPEFVPGELLVQYRPNTSESARAVVAARAGLQAVREFTVAQSGAAVPQLVRLRAGVSTESALETLRRDASVLLAEPNWILKSTVSSNDPQYLSGALWGTYGDASSPANAFGSQAAEAWAGDKTGSSTVYVGIVDEGVMITHEDLKDNIWTNPYDPADGVDNDGNGYVDDTNGWDFFGNDRTVYDGTFDDHGTHVAGIVGAKGGNGVGVAGVNWNVKLIPAKFLGPNGGTTAGAIKAIDYITNLKLKYGLNIVATNNSWSGGGFSQLLFNAITRAAQADILFVAAAGNGGADGVGDNNNTLYTYPANYDTTATAGYDNVISVAAITSTGARASFSNYGSTTVDLGAPGVGIVSTIPGNGNTSLYKSYNGTSMATPFVTGAAALYKSIYPSATAAQIKAAILGTAKPTPALSGITVTGGRLDIGSLIAAPPGGGSSNRTPPTNPTKPVPKSRPNNLGVRVAAVALTFDQDRPRAKKSVGRARASL